MVPGLAIGMSVLGVLLIVVCAIVVIKVVSVKCLKPRKIEPTKPVNSHDGPAAVYVGDENKPSDQNI